MLITLLPIIQIFFVFILIIQVIMAILNITNHKRRIIRLDFVLSSRTTVVEMLEKYSRIFQPLNVKVNADIKSPAVFKRDLLHVNRAWVYEIYAYPALATLMEIIQFQKNSSLRMVLRVQQLLFIAEVVLYYMSFYYIWAIIPAVLVATTALSLGIFYEIKVGGQIESVVEIATDLLDLNEYESQGAFELLQMYQNDGHTYPLSLVIGVMRFFKFW